MAFVTPTDPRAAVVEAAELRKQAGALLAQAEDLDPTPLPEPVKKPKAKAKSKKEVEVKTGKGDK